MATGKHKKTKEDGDLGPVYTPETAAAELGVEPDRLYRLARVGLITHADLGPGLDSEGVWHDHLIRWNPRQLEAARRDLERNDASVVRLIDEGRRP